jgi:membrane protein implicated in regulation of membrane protease activity
MTLPDIYLVCFGVGSAWSITALVLGSLHSGHSHFGHGQAAHAHHTHAHAPGMLASLINPSCAAVFLAWFGGVGYLLTRHSGLGFWLNFAFAVALGLAGAAILAAFLRFLDAREKPLDPLDYEMVGVLGRVSSTIRPDGVGELIYLRDGARKPACARSEDGQLIARGEEVIVTRFEKGIAYVRTWDAMTQPDSRPARTETLPKEIENVE